MSARGSITLGELVDKLDMLEVACHRCDRKGRLSLDRLIAEYGADTGLPDLWTPLAGDCPRAKSRAMHDRCAIYYPQLIPEAVLSCFSGRSGRARKRVAPSDVNVGAN